MGLQWDQDIFSKLSCFSGKQTGQASAFQSTSSSFPSRAPDRSDVCHPRSQTVERKYTL